MNTPYLSQVHLNIRRLCVITTFASSSFMAHAQGHDLCSNSGGFRLAKHFIENDPHIQEEAPNLVQKLTSGEKLTPLEWDFFKQAYEQVAIDSLDEINGNFAAINDALKETERLNLVCTDLTEALDAVLTGSINPADAAEEAFNSTEYLIRGAEQRAFERNTDKTLDHLLINNVINNYADCRVNGEVLLKYTETVLREKRAQVASLDGNQLLDFIVHNIPPADRIKMNTKLSSSATYKIFSTLNVGDGGIIAVDHPIFHFEGTTQTETFAGHTLYFQRISPTDLFLFDTLKIHGTFIKIDTELEKFSSFLTMDTETLYRERVEELEEIKALPESTPDLSQKIKNQIEAIQDTFPFYKEALPPLKNVTANKIFTVSHGPKIPTQ